MTTQQRFEKYIKEHCKRCKNRKGNDCDIRITVTNTTIKTKCDYYEKQD